MKRTAQSSDCAYTRAPSRLLEPLWNRVQSFAATFNLQHGFRVDNSEEGQRSSKRWGWSPFSYLTVHDHSLLDDSLTMLLMFSGADEIAIDFNWTVPELHTPSAHRFALVTKDLVSSEEPKLLKFAPARPAREYNHDWNFAHKISGKYILLGERNDAYVYRFEPDTAVCTLVRRFRLPYEAYRVSFSSCDLSPCGRFLLSRELGHLVLYDLTDITKGRLARKIARVHSGWVSCIGTCVLRNGKSVAIWGLDHTEDIPVVLKLWVVQDIGRRYALRGQRYHRRTRKLQEEPPCHIFRFFTELGDSHASFHHFYQKRLSETQFVLLGKNAHMVYQDDPDHALGHAYLLDFSHFPPTARAIILRHPCHKMTGIVDTDAVLWDETDLAIACIIRCAPRSVIALLYFPATDTWKEHRVNFPSLETALVSYAVRFLPPFNNHALAVMADSASVIIRLE